jgi:hypothetical protein
MRAIWLNDGEPDEHGDYIAVIENAAGARVSTFKGKTYKEVADKLLDSQANANREISRLRKPDQGRTPFKVEPRQLTPDDRFRLSSEITDPAKVVEAVTEIVTAQQGAAPQAVGRALSQQDQQEADRWYLAEARQFAMANPDYYPVPQNRDDLFDEIKANKYDVTANNMAIAWQTLKERGDTIPWPTEAEGEVFQYQLRHPEEPAKPNGQTAAAQPTVEPNTPSPRPRSIATGLRNTDASASPPPPPRRKAVTRADVERMSRVEFTQRLQTDPDFRRQVDAMGA